MNHVPLDGGDTDDLTAEHPALVDPQGWHWVRPYGNLPHSEYCQNMAWREHQRFICDSWRLVARKRWRADPSRHGMNSIAWDEPESPPVDPEDIVEPFQAG